jgi:Uma2 family endonuclease
MATSTRARIEDLCREPGKAEIVGGELIRMAPTGGRPGYAAGEIFASLRGHVRQTRRRRAVTDNSAFRVRLPNRDSFSPDAALYIGPDPGMRFYEGAPVFAAEVRSEGDYAPAAEAVMAAKRRDYFTAGTLVVWDVDLLGEDVVRVHRASDPDRPTVYRRGQLAEAEPAVPGWTLPVDDLFA